VSKKPKIKYCMDCNDPIYKYNSNNGIYCLDCGSSNVYPGPNRILCHRCDGLRPENEINKEAQIHHNAQWPECIDRKACQSRVRKRKRAKMIEKTG